MDDKDRTATCNDLWARAAEIRRATGARRVKVTIEMDGSTLSVEDCAPGVPSAAPAVPDLLKDMPWPT